MRTLPGMAATLTELHRRTKKVIRPVLRAGETVTVTRHGRPAAEIAPLRVDPMPGAAYARRWRASRMSPADLRAVAATMEEARDVAD